MTIRTPLLIWSLFGIGEAMAKMLKFPDAPLFLSLDVKPNIIFAIDDSGSMDDEVLFNSNDGALWWNTGAAGAPAGCPIGFTGCSRNSDGTANIAAVNVPNFNSSGDANTVWHSFVNLFPNGTATGARIHSDGNADTFGEHFALPPLPQFAWARSPAYNAAYFDPAQIYTPWVSYGSATFANIVATLTPSDPARGVLIFDLTQDIASNRRTPASTACIATPPPTGNASDHLFTIEVGMVLPAGTCFQEWRPDAGQNQWTRLSDARTIVASDGLSTKQPYRQVGIRYFPATFYLPSTTVLPSAYGYTATPSTTGLGLDGSPLNGYEIKPGNFGSTASYAAAMQNFANWFGYYRKRHMAMRGGIGKAFNGVGSTRVGSFKINSPPASNSTAQLMSDLDDVTSRNAFFTDIYSNYVGGNGTPNREAVLAIGQQLRRTDRNAPIQYACQKNFGILFTDGYSNNSTPFTGGNVDGTTRANATAYRPVAPFKDSVSNTIADIAMSDYLSPLRTGSGFPLGKQNLPSACNGPNPSQSLDCNSNLHEVLYGVTLGAQGIVYGVDSAATADPYAHPPAWPLIFPPRHPSAVDDLWHATLNARGQLLNARTPVEIADGLGTVLRDVAERAGSAAAVTLNSGVLDGGTRLYQSRFNSSDWSGQLISYPVSMGVSAVGTCSGIAAGQLCPLEWDAGQVLNTQAPTTGRSIITYDRSQTTVSARGIPFRWNNLSTAQRAALNAGPVAPHAADGNGSARLGFLRGSRSNESTSANPRFRVRSSVLGDVIDSDPFFVGPPPYAYGFNAYASFRAANYNRTPIVYVGANDGMLHGFRASDGHEVLAYVPGSVFGTAASPILGRLTSQSYSHLFTVDGSPTTGDAYFGKQGAPAAWHSILVGSLRSGGQGIYALDVTDPSQFNELNSGSLALWEFTDADDADLGNTFGQPSIVRLANGKWVVIVGNGYNGSAADGRASTTGKAALFVLNLEGPTGANGTWVPDADYVKIVVNAGTVAAPNGLATPAAVDIDGDGAIDRVYAGDLLGDLWRFDVTGASTPAWTIAYSSQPLFKARSYSGVAQPITTRPEIGYNLLSPATRDVTVYFGTGRYLEASDNSTIGTQTQTFYGIFDEDYISLPTIARDSMSSSGNLQKQSVLREVSASGNGCTANTSGCLRVVSRNTLDITRQNGWFIDLYDTHDGSVDDHASPAAVNFGERQITTATLRNGRIIFTTLIPSSDPCEFGGGGWLLELDARTGARVPRPVFDVTNDGTVDSGDVVLTKISGALVSVPASGVGSTVGLLARPAILGIGNTLETKYSAGSTAAISIVTESAGGRLGRITWRELTPP